MFLQVHLPNTSNWTFITHRQEQKLFVPQRRRRLIKIVWRLYRKSTKQKERWPKVQELRTSRRWRIRKAKRIERIEKIKADNNNNNNKKEIEDKGNRTNKNEKFKKWFGKLGDWGCQTGWKKGGILIVYCSSYPVINYVLKYPFGKLNRVGIRVWSESVYLHWWPELNQ